ncbi:putative PEP-binding protein [Streptomyces sp. NPDC055186]
MPCIRGRCPSWTRWRALARADTVRRLEVRANADTPEDAMRARRFGAQGIGLCRTEHMLLGERRKLVAEAARIMAQREVKRLPVVSREGLLEGVVSRVDLLKVFLRTDGELAEEVDREVVSRLFPAPLETVRGEVSDGVVTLTGRVRDTSLVPVAARAARAVEGVVDVECHLTS